jgi:TatD DNase family protein
MAAEPEPGATPAPLVDTHSHLTSPQLHPDLPGVIGRARAVGVVRIVDVGTTAGDSRLCVEDARRHPELAAAVAIHPNDVAAAAPGDWETIRSLASEPEVVAIGETGLDRYRDRTPFPAQESAFVRHLDLARERDLPILIHCREAYADVIGHLERSGGPVRGILHSFTGTGDDALALVELGLSLSFAGMITFTNKALDSLRAVAARVPADRLLVETDSPYLAPHPHRGHRNEPAHVAWTARRLAEVRGLTPDELARLTTRNAIWLFRFPDLESDAPA